MKNLIAILILSLTAGIDNSCAQEYAGKDFWLAFMDIDGCSPRPSPIPSPNPPLHIFYYDTTELYLTSRHNATVYVSIRKGNWGDNGPDVDYLDTFFLTPGITTHVLLPLGIMIRTINSDFVLTNGVHIVADSNIYVEAASLLAKESFPSSRGATAVLPSSSLPNAPEYVITTNESTTSENCNPGLGHPPRSSSEFIIVGIAEESIVEIFPTSSSLWGSSKAYKPVVIKLKQGDAFLYTGVFENGIIKDLTGSTIRSRTSQSKFAVFAGNIRTGSSLKNASNVLCNGAYLDFVYEQLKPVGQWGVSYTALPYVNNKGGYFLRITPVENNTIIRIDNAAPITLNAGKHYTLNVNTDTAVHITGNKIFSVTQFAKSPGCNQFQGNKTAMGNLSMIYLAPDNQMATEAFVNPVDFRPLYSLDSQYRPERYVNVLCRTTDTAFFKLNGLSIPSVSWKQQQAIAGFSYAQINIDSSNFLLQNSKGFIAYQYGYRYREGIALTVAARHKLLNYNFIYTQSCKNDTAWFEVVNADSIQTIKWHFENDPNVLTGPKIKYFFKDTGFINVRMTAFNMRTNQIDTLSKRIYIDIANQTPVLCSDTLICGPVAFTLTPNRINIYNDYTWNGGHPNASQYIKNPGLYWLKIFERNGCTFIDTVIISTTPKPVANFKVSDTAVCSNFNRKIRFENLSTSFDSVVSNIWDFGDFYPIDTNADTIYYQFPKVGQFQYRLTVTTYKNCVDDTFGFFEIKKGPDAKFIMINKDTCLKSNQVTFVNQTQKDSLLHKRFKWYFSEGYVISNSNPPGPRKYLKDSDYVAQLIYENQNGCIDTAFGKIKIYKEPQADFSTDKPLTCLGYSTEFKDISVSKYKPLTTYWNIAGSLDSSSQPIRKFDQMGWYNVSLKVVSPQGCIDTIAKNVYVGGGVKADIVINDTAQCLSDNLFVFEDNSLSDSGTINSKIWELDNKLFSNKDSVHYIFKSANNYYVKLKVSNSFNCRDSLTISVQTLKNPVPKIKVNDLSQCERSQSFEFLNSNKTVGSDVVWYYNGDSSISYPLGSVSFSGLGKKLVVLKENSIQGCKGIDSVYVIVNPNPKASFLLSDTAMCFSLNSFIASNQSTISSGKIASQLWSFGDGVTDNIFQPSAHKYKDSGFYNIKLIVQSDSLCSDTISKTVYVYPGIQLSVPAIQAVCFGDSTSFKVLSLNKDTQIYQPKWQIGDGIEINRWNFKYKFPEIGAYKARLLLLSGNGCGDTIDAPNQAIVYPLPSVDFSVSFRDGMSGNTLGVFRNLSSGVRKSYWDFYSYGKAYGLDTTLDFRDSQTIRVSYSITDYNGCSDTVTRNYFVGLPYNYFLPNAFTPNGDGINEKFGPVGITYAYEYSFKIYNRWGELIYEGNDFTEFWDGTYKGNKCPNGVYVYRLVFRDYFGRYKESNGTFLLKW